MRPYYNVISIRQLQHENVTITSDPHAMREITTRYYSSLLSLETFSVDALTCRSQVWNTLEPNLTPHMNVQL